jgi:hypothetical protein
MKSLFISLIVLTFISCGSSKELLNCEKSKIALEYQNEILRRQINSVPDTVFYEVPVVLKDTVTIVSDSALVYDNLDSTWQFELPFEYGVFGLDINIQYKYRYLWVTPAFIPSRTAIDLPSFQTVKRDTIPDPVSLQRAEIAETKNIELEKRVGLYEQTLSWIKWISIVVFCIIISYVVYTKFSVIRNLL